MPLELETEPRPMLARLNPDDPLFEQVLALEKRQEAAVLTAKDVLAKEYGAKVEVVQYSYQKDGILVVYRITKQNETSQPEPTKL